jgi:probable phosphoglycerate mutase
MITLVRHGQTDWIVAGRIHGRSDVPLNEEGRHQARVVADHLRSQRRAEPLGWSQVVSSPLARARETAAIIAASMALPVADAEPLWAEQDYGIGEGMIADELWAAWPGYDQPGKEHDDAVAQRGLEALEKSWTKAAGRDVLIVAHGNIIRYALQRVLGHTIEPLPNTATATVERNGDSWEVVSWGGLQRGSSRVPRLG